MLRKLKKRGTAVAAIFLTANLLFWILVGVNFGPVSSLYERGLILKLGPVAFVFGHGVWREVNGVEQHWTEVSTHGGEFVETLQLLQQLHARGARWIWGAWCYSGDHSYIAKDLLTGKETPWPAYVSRNQKPGKTLPVWLGLGFIRFSLGHAHAAHPARRFFSDTLKFGDYWLQESPEFPVKVLDEVRWQFNAKDLGEPDSIGFIARDTIVYHEPYTVAQQRRMWNVSWNRRMEMLHREAEYWQSFVRLRHAAIRTEQIDVWVRDRAVRVWITAPPVEVDQKI